MVNPLAHVTSTHLVPAGAAVEARRTLRRSPHARCAPPCSSSAQLDVLAVERHRITLAVAVDAPPRPQQLAKQSFTSQHSPLQPSAHLHCPSTQSPCAHGHLHGGGTAALAAPPGRSAASRPRRRHASTASRRSRSRTSSRTRRRTSPRAHADPCAADGGRRARGRARGRRREEAAAAGARLARRAGVPLLADALAVDARPLPRARRVAARRRQRRHLARLTREAWRARAEPAAARAAPGAVGGAEPLDDGVRRGCRAHRPHPPLVARAPPELAAAVPGARRHALPQRRLAARAATRDVRELGEREPRRARPRERRRLQRRRRRLLHERHAALAERRGGWPAAPPAGSGAAPLAVAHRDDERLAGSAAPHGAGRVGDERHRKLRPRGAAFRAHFKARACAKSFRFTRRARARALTTRRRSRRARRRPVGEDGAADDVLPREEAPEVRVERVVPVVAEDEDALGRHAQRLELVLAASLVSGSSCATPLT